MVVGVAILVAGLAVGVAVLGGFVDAPTAGPGESTPEPARPVTTPTLAPTPTATAAPTPTPTPTPTATASPTPTTTATPTATPNTEQYRPFVKQYVEELRIFTVIYSAPVELRGSRVVDDELWIAANITSLAVNESRRYDQYDALLFSYAKANEKHYTRRIAGKAPSGFRVVEVGTRPGDDPLTLRVNRSVARRHTEWELNVSETRVIWADSRRTPTDRERETAADIDRGGRNLTIAPGSGQQESEGDG